jgi:hypothetical protein
MGKNLKNRSSIRPAGENLAKVLIEMNQELKKQQTKMLHHNEEEHKQKRLEYNFDFGTRKFAFCKNSLYCLPDNNSFRRALVRFFTHPYDQVTQSF